MVTVDVESDIKKYLSSTKGIDVTRLLSDYHHYLSKKGYEDEKKFIGQIDPNLNIYKIINVNDMSIRVDDNTFSLSDVFNSVYEKAVDVNKAIGKNKEIDPYVTITPNGKEPISFHYKGLLTLILLIMLARSSNFRSLEEEVLVKATTFSYFNKYDVVTEAICSSLDEYMALARALQAQNLLTSDVIRMYSHNVCRSSDGNQLDLIQIPKLKK